MQGDRVSSGAASEGAVPESPQKPDSRGRATASEPDKSARELPQSWEEFARWYEV